MLATHVISQLRQSFGIELPIAAIFERPTVAALTEGVLRAMWMTKLKVAAAAILALAAVGFGAGLVFTVTQPGAETTAQPAHRLVERGLKRSTLEHAQ